jgi:hypothetical protein
MPLNFRYPAIWSPAAFDDMVQMAADGRSTKQMAAALSEKYGAVFSRSAVIGKAYREGVQLQSSKQGRPTKPTKHKDRDKVVRVKRDPKWLRRLEQNDAPVERIPPLNIPFMDHRKGMCHDVVGTGGDGLALYCGHPTDGGPWCPPCLKRNTQRPGAVSVPHLQRWLDHFEKRRVEYLGRVA